MSPTPDELTALREAVLTASDPHEGRHIAAMLIVSIWELDADPINAVADFIGTPPDHMGQIIRMIQEMPRL